MQHGLVIPVQWFPEKVLHSSTPLHFAAEQGHTCTVGLLIRYGASIEAMDNSNRTPLHLAAWYGHTIIVELLFRKAASIKARDKYGYTPLNLAAQYRCSETAQKQSCC